MEHSDIIKMNRTGELHPQKVTYCPMCGSELDSDSTVYTLNIRGEVKIIGCNECVEAKTTADL